MPIVRLKDRRVMYVYDRWDVKTGTNGRKTLKNNQPVYISDETLEKLRQLGVTLEVEGESRPEKEETPVVETLVEESSDSDSLDTSVSKKKKKKKKAKKKVEE